jgi:hypothetical protein
MNRIAEEVEERRRHKVCLLIPPGTVLYVACSNPAPYTLPPTPYTLHPTPYTLLPTPCILNPNPNVTRSSAIHCCQPVGFGFRVSGFGLGVCYVFWVSGFGLEDLGKVCLPSPPRALSCLRHVRSCDHAETDAVLSHVEAVLSSLVRHATPSNAPACLRL